MFCLQLDYISRLMWQAQLQGNKTWMLSPAPECDRQCEKFSFRVEPGDAGTHIEYDFHSFEGM